MAALNQWLKAVRSDTTHRQLTCANMPHANNAR